MERHAEQLKVTETLDKYKEVIAAACLVAISVALYYSAGGIRILQPNSASYINSRFFPYLIAGFLFLASLFEFFACIRRLSRARAPGDAKAGMDKAGIFRIAATLLLLGAYVALLNTLGFLIMTVVYLFGQILLLTPDWKRHIPFAACLSAAASGLIYWTFAHVLTLMLPRGPLPF
jgi:putative tricarboxylic transport membrane protein